MPKTKEQLYFVKEKRKREIMISALKVFCIKSFEGATVDDITKEAKVSHGLFYHYFKSKQEILTAVLQEKESVSNDELYEEVKNEPSYREKLRIILKKIFYNLKNDEAYSYYFYFFVSQCFSHKDKVNSCNKTSKKNHPVEKLEQLFKKGQEAGEFTTKYSARELAENFFLFTQGTSIIYTIAPKDIQNKMKLPDINLILDVYCKGDAR